MVWQRAYHHTHPRHPAARRWLHKQQQNWLLLHPQQHLLTTAGLVNI
ncbi:hypothetical protein ACFV5J_34475 [Streptomyces zaomyceticus]